MKKRAQITIFIILALIVIFAVGIYFIIISQSEVDIDAQKSGPAGEVYNYVDDCVKNAALSATENFGFQQGYHIIPEDRSIETIFYRIAYYYLRGTILIPTNEFFEKELGKILNDRILEDCSDFSNFENVGYIIDFDNPNTKTTILEDSIIVNVDYPIRVRIIDTTSEISKFTYTLPIRLGHIIDVSKILVEEIKKEPYSMDLTLFLNQDISISVVNYDSCNQIYLLEDEQSETSTGDPYFFAFGVGFNEEFCFERQDVGSGELNTLQT